MGTTTYTYNALNQLVTEISDEGTITYTFDDNGNLIKQTGDKTVDYSYDKENHLLRATIQQGNSVTIESYTYDYTGNRTSKTVNETDATYYVNDTSSSLTMVVVETDKDGNETAYYTRGDELLSMESGSEIWYYLYDGHGSVRTLTNEAGRVTDRYSYDAYGNLLEKEGDTKNEFLYTGEQYNANTGLYYLRARYMNPSTGTFISMDSYQGSIYDPVTLHKYLYANANPVKYTDPSGYMSFPELHTTMTAKQILSASWKFITINTVIGAFTGAACGAIDSILGGNDFSKVVQDAFHGAWVGAFWGCVVSALACYAVISPFCMMFLHGVQGFFLISGIVGSFVSAKEGNVAQSIFRGILGIIAYIGTGKLIDAANVRIIEGGNLSVNDFINQNVDPNFQQCVKDAFLNDVKVTVLQKNTIVYRYHGGQSSGKSFWYTPNQTANPAADLALPPGNTYQYMDVYVIPKGTTILEGTVAPNFGQPGGGYQYYVPDPSVVFKK